MTDNTTLERILELMKEQNITAQDMEIKIGASRGTFSNWKRQKGRSYFEYIDRLADQLGVTIDYLIRGEDMKTDTLSHDEFELISNYRKLSSKAKNHIVENIKLILGE